MAETLFLSAQGAHFTLIDKTGQSYPPISWRDILAMVREPQAVEKLQAWWIIPSTYREYDGRSHDAQRQRGAFRLLCIDVDTGNHDRQAILETLERICGNAGLVIYSSSSASESQRKWRILIPLKETLTGDEYEDAQLALFALMAAQGITCDAALARPGQPVYLPNVPTAKRGPTQLPIFYEWQIVRGPTFSLAGSPVEAEIRRRLAEAEQAAQEAAQARMEREKERASRRPADGADPIVEFNTRHSIADLLARYSYERRGSSTHYRSRYQTSGSHATRDYGTHWVSLSASDAAAGLGRSKALGGMSYTWGDAFDLFAHYEHGGDLSKAVKAFAGELKPTHEAPRNALDDFDTIPQALEPQIASASTIEAGEEPDWHTIPNPFTEPPPEAAWPTLYDAWDASAIPPRRWIYHRHYLRSFVSVLASAGGIGKTSLQIVEAIAIVTGRPLLGEPVIEPCNVWIVNLEDPIEELQRRVLAAMQHYGISREEVDGRLFLDAGRNFSMNFGTGSRDGVIPNEALVNYLIEKIPERKIGCVFIDPFVGAHQVNENDNMATNAILAEIRRVADLTGCAIGLVHHNRKENGGDASIDSVRGASSLIGAARVARVINRISEDDAAKLGLPIDQRRGVFRVDDGKANLSPPALKAVYRIMIGVQIANGEWVGVCTPLQLRDEFDGMTADITNEMLEIIDDGITEEDGSKEYYSARAQDKARWAGKVIMDYRFSDPELNKSEMEAKQIIKKWLETGLLEEMQYTSQRQRKARTGIRSTGKAGKIADDL